MQFQNGRVVLFRGEPFSKLHVIDDWVLAGFRIRPVNGHRKRMGFEFSFFTVHMIFNFPDWKSWQYDKKHVLCFLSGGFEQRECLLPVKIVELCLEFSRLLCDCQPVIFLPEDVAFPDFSQTGCRHANKTKKCQKCAGVFHFIQNFELQPCSPLIKPVIEIRNRVVLFPFWGMGETYGFSANGLPMC